MYAIVRVLWHKVSIFLCFANKEVAERFVEFVETYHDEVLNNGHGVYGFDSVENIKSIMFCEKRHGDFVGSLDRSSLDRMLVEIIRNRLDDPEFELGDELFLDFNVDEILEFSVDRLPPRQRPTKGQYCSLPMSKNNGHLMVGKVIEDRGDKLLLEMVHDHSTVEVVVGEERVVSSKDVMRCLSCERSLC